MDKFSPLDLGEYLNADRSNSPIPPFKSPPWQAGISEGVRRLPGSRQTFWGVPFRLRPEGDDKCWLVLGSNESSVGIAVPSNQLVSYILFCHFCNASLDPQERQPTNSNLVPVLHPGQRLADYVLIYDDHSEHRQEIRRRFEINEPLVAWGHLAFAARPHTKDTLIAWNGPHQKGQWGEDQTTVRSGAFAPGYKYWIYALPNPQPYRRLTTIQVEATGADTFAIAGITLYHGQYHPLRYRQRATLRLSLPREEAALPGEVEVSADLGIVARVHAPRKVNPETWTSQELMGCGEEALAPEPTSELLVDLSAAPDVTLTVGTRNIDLRDAFGGNSAKSSDGKTRVEFVRPEKLILSSSIVDASTNTPTPARVHFRDPDGRYLPPRGHRAEVNDNWFEDYGGDLKLGSTEYAYVDGTFQVEVPVGDCYVEVSKGFEFEPLRARLQIGPHESHLTLRLLPAANLRQEGWVTADTHVHFLSPQTAWLEARGEGVNLVNLLAAQWGDLFTNVCDITGSASGVSREDTIVWVGTENRQHLLGHMSLLGVDGTPILPLSAAGPEESTIGDPIWTSMAQWADCSHKQNGLAILPHFPTPYAEAAADIVLGKIDGVEIRDFYTPSFKDFGILEWYRFLNLGYRLPVVGGTDKMSAGMPVGGVRTYAYIGQEEFTFESWARAIRSGRTFTTSGPLIGIEIEGRTMGDEVHLPRGGGVLETRAWADSVFPFDLLQLVVNGQIIAEAHSDATRKKARLATRTKFDHSSWVAARCIGMDKIWHCWPVHVAAHTSPIYISVEDGGQFNPLDCARVLTLLDGGLSWIASLSVMGDPEQEASIKAVFEHARQQLSQRLEKHQHGDALD